MRHLDDPAPRTLAGLMVEFALFLPATFNMRSVAMRLDGVQCQCAGIAGIGTQMLGATLGRIGTFDHD